MKKKFVLYLVVGVLLFSVFGQADAVRASSVVLGVDVSSHQGIINWDLVDRQIDFAILRLGYGQDRTKQDDTYWYRNADACTRLNIPFGAYLYSHALTDEAARSEAEHAVRLAKGYNLPMPIYLDLEDETILRRCTYEEILRHVTIFCDIVSEAGFTPGVYANTTWWENYLTSPEYDKYDRWIAQYSSNLNYGRPYSVWQYTDKGCLNGIEGAVDLNYWYGDSNSSECFHNYTCNTVRESNCTADGLRIFTCSLCGDSFEETTVASGHNYRDVVVEPTCSEGGYTMFTCSCGDSYVANVTPPQYHSRDNGRITVMPTEEGTGQIIYSCTFCGRVMSVEEIPSIREHMSVCPSQAYEDVPHYMHWAHEGIDLGLQDGLFRGVSEDRFDPEGVMTRAMIVTALWRLDECPRAETVCNFKDVDPEAWYAEAVAWAQENDIVNGIGEGYFNPMGTITREQFAAILYRYELYLGGVGYIPGDALDRFSDENAVSDYAREALAWAVHRDVITGTVVDHMVVLDPLGTATRAQAATILRRLPRG